VGKQYENLKSQGLAVMIVLSEDWNYNPPTPEFCHEYAKETGVDPAHMLMDNGFTTLFKYMDAGSFEFALPWEGILNGVGMTYEWNSVSGGNGQSIISGLLN
jgi:hypothetical protein